MSASVSQLKEKFALLKYEQLLAEKYFIETCFSKKFSSLPAKEELKDLLLKMATRPQGPEGIQLLDCHLPQIGCDENGETTTTTTTQAPVTTTTTIP